MAFTIKRYRLWAIPSGLVALAACYALSGPPLTPPEREFKGIMADWSRANNRYGDQLRRANGSVARKEARAELEKQIQPLAGRCLALSRSFPGSPQELAGLCWAVGNALETEEGRTAKDMLAAGRIASADPGHLSWALGPIRDAPRSGALAPLVLDRVKQGPEDPQAARLLTWVCTTTKGDEDKIEVSPYFTEAADLITSRHVGSPDIVNFCEGLGMGHGSPLWAGRFESHLRRILEENRHREVRCAARLRWHRWSSGAEARASARG